MSDPRAHVAYRHLLMRSGHGYPLWIPEPDAGLPAEYQREGVTIGDLGLLTAGGGFDFILNVHLDAHHPVNAGNVPPDFMSLPLRELGPNPIRQTLPMHRPEAAITSSDVSRRSLSFDASAEAPGLAGGGFGIEFSTARTQAAILTLPTGANRYDAKNRSVYEKYAAQHAKSWYQYVNVDLGRRACSGTLYLVTGCDKCLSWGAAAFCHPERSTEVSLKFLAGGLGGGSLSLASSWDTTMGVETRLFPSPGISTYGYENQCVFTRGLCIAVRDKLFKQIFSRSATVLWINGDPDDYQPSFGGHIPFSSSSSSSSMSPPSSSSQSSTPSGSQRQSSSEASGSPRDDSMVQCPDEEGDRTESDEDSQGFLKSELLNPSCQLSRYILQMYPEVEVAIVHDEDWITELGETTDSESDGFSSRGPLSISKEPVVVDGVGYLKERPVAGSAPKGLALFKSVHDSPLDFESTHGGASTFRLTDGSPVYPPFHAQGRHDLPPASDPSAQPGGAASPTPPPISPTSPTAINAASSPRSPKAKTKAKPPPKPNRCPSKVLSTPNPEPATFPPRSPNNKRPYEEDAPPATAPGATPSFMNGVTNEPSPPKKLKTDWEGPSNDTLKQREEQATKVETEEDVRVALDQILELIKMDGGEGQEALSSDISDISDIILSKGYSAVPHGSTSLGEGSSSEGRPGHHKSAVAGDVLPWLLPWPLP